MQRIHKLPKVLCSFLILSLFFVIACDSSNNSGNGEECIGIDFSEIECIGEFLSTDGLRFGCDKCTSDLRTEEFNLEFSPLMVSPDEAPNGVGTQFRVDGVQDSFIPGFVDCSTVDLFEITQNQSGENVSGEMVGSLEDIETVLPDKLSLTITVPEIDGEVTFCDFCWVPVRPPCADEL